MPALCLYAFSTYYAQNYASIIWKILLITCMQQLASYVSMTTDINHWHLHLFMLVIPRPHTLFQRLNLDLGDKHPILAGQGHNQIIQVCPGHSRTVGHYAIFTE